MPTPTPARITAVVALALLFGCADRQPNLPHEQVRQLAAIPYPADAQWGEDLDIIVVHQGAVVQLVNRTPRDYENVRLWFNQQYVRPVERLEIGPNNLVDLRKAVNEHGQAYPVGSFLKPDQRAVLVQAELFDPGAGVRHRLIVQPVKPPQ